jgi:hypothetical protein
MAPVFVHRGSPADGTSIRRQQERLTVMAEQPKLVQLDDPGFYTLPTVREFAMLAPAVNGREARIRLRLGGAITLDLPLSRKSLIALEHDLSQYLAKPDHS